VFLEKFPTGNCPATQPAAGKDAVAFTMACTAAERSALHNLSKGETVTISPTENPLGESGECEFPTSSPPAAEARSLPQQPQSPQTPAGPQAPAQSSPQQPPPPSAPIKSEHEGNPSGVSRSEPKEPIAAAGLPGTVAGPTGSRESSAEGLQKTTTPSLGTASSSTQTTDRAAEGPGGTQTPSTPQGRSGTPSPATSAGGNDATTTTAAITTRSPSDGNDAKSNADGSATNSNTTQKAVANAADRSATSTSFVRAPLMLLLTAALSCAAA
ncbi:uncharacterized protein Tco025E_08739, partial [Trypanosoma conorhini]